MFRTAIARKPGRNARLGLTTAQLGEPDPGLMRAQHDAYLRALTACGVSVTVLEADEQYPDGCFVEDVAVVTSECIVVTRSGAPSRRGESAAIEPLLSAHGRLERIVAPGQMDGGDVIVAGKRVLVGISKRTNREGARQLEAILSPYGMDVRPVPVDGGLHLKSDVNYLGNDRLIMTTAYTFRDELADFARIVVPSGEEYAANSLPCGDRVLVPEGFAQTRNRLEQTGFSVLALDMSEFRKMDGGLTCLSIRLESDHGRADSDRAP
jgi:dimethylargininase